MEQGDRRRHIRCDARNQLFRDVSRAAARDDGGATADPFSQRWRSGPARCDPKSCYEQGVKSPYVFQGIAAFEKLFERAEKDLTASSPWLLGESYTLADISLTPFVARLEYLDLLDLWVAKRPHTQAWWQRAKSRPSFASVIANALTANEVSEMRTFGSGIRNRVGERRFEYLSDYPQQRFPELLP